MTVLADAFIELHAEGATLPAEIEAQATVGAAAAEATITESLAAAGTAGGAVAGEGIAAGIIDWTTFAATTASEELVVTTTEGGVAAGQGAGAGIATGIREGAAAGLASVQEEFAAKGAAAGGAFGKGLLAASPQIIGAAIAVGVLGKVIGSSVTSAEEAEKAHLNLANALQNNYRAATLGIDAYERQSAALQDLTGYEDEAIQGAQAILANFQLTGQQIKETTPLVLDFAAKTGRDVPEAASLLGRAFLGNTRALKALGINYTGTGDLATDFAAITDLVRSRVGGFAEELGGTLQGNLRKFDSNLDDIKETLGGFFLPTLNSMAGGLNAGANAAAGQAEQVSFLDSVLLTTIPSISSFNAVQHLMNADQEKAASFLEQSTTVLGKWGQQLGSGKITAAEFNTRLDAMASSARDAGVADEVVNQVLQNGKGILRSYAQDTLGVVDARKADIAAAREQQIANLALAGGYAGIIGTQEQLRTAQEGVAKAQARVTHLEDQNLTHTKRYRDARRELTSAVADAVIADQSFNEAVLNQAKAMDAQGASAKEVRQEVRLLGEDAGLTKDQVGHLIERVDDATNSVKGMPDKVDIIFSSNVDQERDKVENFDRILDGIQGRHVTAHIDVINPSDFGQPGGIPGTGNGGNNGGGNGGGHTSHSNQQGDDNVTQRVLLPTPTAVEIELDGKTIYDSGFAYGERRRVRFKGRDDG